YPLRPHMYKSLGFAPPYARSTVPPEVIPIEELSVASHLAPWSGEIVHVFDKRLPGTVINFSEGRSSYLLAKEYEDIWLPTMRRLVLKRVGAAERRTSGSLPRMKARPQIVIRETST